MKVYIDRRKVHSRAAAANSASVSGLLVLLVSVAIPLFLPRSASFSWLLSIGGAAISMIGIYLANRWVRKPRPEDSLDRALKAFDDRHQLFHYPALPCDHILLTPAGVLAMEVVNLPGRFSHQGGHWKESMTMGRALRYIVEPRVGDPVLFAKTTAQELQDRFLPVVGADAVVPIRALMVFTHPAVVLDTSGASIPACKIEKLRKQAVINSAGLAPDTYEKLSSYLERETTT
jgi:hypothetical protein